LMSNCCCPPKADDSATALPCPVSGSRGSAVETITVKALLTERALCRLLPGEYRFCPDPDCDVVYFSTDGQRFTTAEVRVPVWQKLPFGDRPICYCFGESEASMRAEIASGAGVRVIERVRAHIAAKRCACDVRNPRGACCLGDVIASVGRIEASVADAVNGAADLCRTSI
jgi:Zinc binding domain